MNEKVRRRRRACLARHKDRARRSRIVRQIGTDLADWFEGCEMPTSRPICWTDAAGNQYRAFPEEGRLEFIPVTPAEFIPIDFTVKA